MKSLLLLLIIFSLSSLGVLPVHAQNDFGDFESGIIDGSIQEFININKNTPLVRFMGLVINILTGVIVVIGVISIVIGGYMYMTAGGDSGRVSQAKVWISSALLGIILALGAYIALNTLGPQFTPSRDPILEPIEDSDPPPFNPANAGNPVGQSCNFTFTGGCPIGYKCVAQPGGNPVCQVAD